MPEVSSHGGSVSVAPGREGCLYIDPLDHSSSILCLCGMTQRKSRGVLTFEVHVTKLTSANLSSTCHVTTSLGVCVCSIRVFLIIHCLNCLFLQV